MSFFSKMARVAKAYKNKTALVISNTSYSYDVLLKKSYSLSRHFINYHDQNKICVVLSGKSIGLYVGMLACFYANVIYTPLNVNSPSEKNKKILAILQSYFILVDDIDSDVLSEILSIVSGKIILFSNKKLYKNALENAGDNTLHLIDGRLNYSDQQGELYFYAKNDPHNIAYLFFTSGSTGTPKAVPISYKNINTYVEDCTSTFSFSGQDRFIQLSDIAFDISIHEIIISLFVGATLYIYDEQNELNISAFLYKNEITQLVVVPSMIPFLVEQSQFYHTIFYKIKCVLVCGESFPLSFAKMLTSIMPHSVIVNLYGPTEATVVCAYHVYQRNYHYHSLHTVPIGKPFSQTSLEMTESNELIIVGDQVSSGYWFSCNKKSNPFFNHSDKNKMAYFTGDRVSYDKNVGYCFHGRFDDQWQVNGYRVEKNEIETILRDVMNTPDIRVIAQKDQANRVMQLIAFSTQSIDIADYKNKLLAFLPAAAIPISVHQLPIMPRLSNGKINYKRLSSEINL